MELTRKEEKRDKGKGGREGGGTKARMSEAGGEVSEEKKDSRKLR